MGGYPTGPEECAPPECEPRITSLRDAAPIAVFAFWGVVVAYLTLYFLAKLLRSQRRHIPPTRLELSLYRPSKSQQDDKPREQVIPAVNSLKQDTRVAVNLNGRYLLVTGYRRSIFGLIGYSLCCLVSASCTALFVLVLYDYYRNCQVSGIDGLCFYGDYYIFGSFDFNSKIMFAIWWLTAVWFFTWVLNYGKVRNWFREVCYVGQAGNVHVWAPAEVRILTANASPLVWLVRHAKSVLYPMAFRGHGQTLRVHKTRAGLKYFVFEGMRFIVSGDKLTRASFVVGTSYMDYHQAAKGLQADEAAQRLDLLGSNSIPYKATSWPRLFVDECFRLFHVYQYIMYTLQMWNSYLFVASLDVLIVVLAGLISIFSLRRSQKAIEKVTEYETTAPVLRGGQWQVLPSSQLVPGDVIKIRSKWLLPCDCVLIQGSCVCNEANLTGEALPIQKQQCPVEDVGCEVKGGSARHTLLSSTLVVQAGNSHSEDVVAVVSATGMATSRGQLMSTIIFPAPMVFKYDEELPIVIALMILFAIPCAVLTIVFQYSNGSYSEWPTKFVYCMGIVNQCLNPLLPVVLTIGDVQAVRRLKAMGIVCLDSRRVAIAGKICAFALDKTGTLTQAWLDFLAVQPVPRTKGPRSGHAMDQLQYLDKNGHVQADTLVTWGLATCHDVSQSDLGLVGNEVEVKMFAVTGWNLEQMSGQPSRVAHPVDAQQQLTVVRVNEFEHSRRSMSVVALDESSGELHVFCKGSFEMIGEMASGASVPADYLQMAEQHAAEGCYVLAMAHRSLGAIPVQQAASLSRDELESGLDMLALLLFRNELRSDTAEAVQHLKHGQVRPIMVTGDSAYCAHYIGRACGLIEEAADLLLADVDASGDVAWSFAGSRAQDNKLQVKMSTQQVIQEQRSALDKQQVELAVTGAAFAKLQQSECMEQLLFHTRIFARFSPEQKADVVGMYQRAGIVMGMCGDGGNDCGALRAAHAGLALSDADASLVSPFTSRTKSVRSIVDLLREGRCALHTRLACYKFLITYGLHFSVLNLVCTWYGMILSQMVFISIDIFATICLGYCLTLAHPAKKLYSGRPTSSLLGARTIVSVVGIWVLDVAFVVAALEYMRHQPGYVLWPAQYVDSAEWWVNGDNWECSVLFFVMYFQYITCALAYALGSTFRLSLFYNWAVVGLWTGLMTMTTLLLLLRPCNFTHVWHIASEQFNSVNDNSPVWASYREAGGAESPAMSFDFRIKLWALCMGNVILIMLFQKFVAEGLGARAFARLFPSKRVRLQM
ncbi:hypothetical protein ABBQ38_010509 [Trebouxia sp. C0009 RCD-2024]